MKRGLLAAVIATLAVGAGGAFASIGVQHPAQKWLVYLGHRVSASKFATIKVYVTGDPGARAADAHAIKLLEGMGAPRPDQTIGAERVIVNAAGTAHKWLVVLGHQGSTITVGVIGYPDASTADARAIRLLEKMGAPAPDQTGGTKAVIIRHWKLHHH